MKKKKKNSKQFNQKFKKQFFTKKSAVVIILTLVIVAFLGFGLMQQNKHAARYQEAIQELSSEVESLEDQNKSLEEEKDNMDSEEFKERMAREKLGLIDNDEYAVREAEGEEEASNPAGGDTETVGQNEADDGDDSE
ncbi:MAG: septum formation initiator family protein [Eubacterium sp.]|nr:septum formation initiator family protein [Eubacterium sp.]